MDLGPRPISLSLEGDIKINLYGASKLRMYFYRETASPHESEEVFLASLTRDEARALGIWLLDFASTMATEAEVINFPGSRSAKDGGIVPPEKSGE